MSLDINKTRGNSIQQFCVLSENLLFQTYASLKYTYIKKYESFQWNFWFKIFLELCKDSFVISLTTETTDVPSYTGRIPQENKLRNLTFWQ